MTKTTITRATALTAAIALCEREGMTAEADVLNKMLTSITKARKDSGKPSKAAVENANLAVKVLAVMPQGKSVTSLWIGEHVPELPTNPTTGKVSVQKVTAVMRLLVDAGKVIKAKEGKVTTYTLV